MKRSVAAAVCVIASLSAGTTVWGLAGNPGVAPPNSRPHGRSYAEWSAAWWQWGLSQPVTGHPFIDSPDFDVSRGQSGHVWFLGAPTGAPVARTCNIPPGTALFVGIVNSEWSDLEGFATEQEQRENAVYFGDHIRGVSFTIDGRDVSGIRNFRFTSAQFGFDAPTPWIFGATGGHGTSVADGYYVMVEPLSAGSHTIHFAGAFHFAVAEGDPFDLDVPVDMTYHLSFGR